MLFYFAEPDELHLCQDVLKEIHKINYFFFKKHKLLTSIIDTILEMNPELEISFITKEYEGGEIYRDSATQNYENYMSDRSNFSFKPYKHCIKCTLSGSLLYSFKGTDDAKKEIKQTQTSNIMWFPIQKFDPEHYKYVLHHTYQKLKSYVFTTNHQVSIYERLVEEHPGPFSCSNFVELDVRSQKLIFERYNTKNVVFLSEQLGQMIVINDDMFIGPDPSCEFPLFHVEENLKETINYIDELIKSMRHAI